MKFVRLIFCRFPCPSSVWRCLLNRFGHIQIHFLPTLFTISAYLLCSLPIFVPHAFSCVHMADVTQDILFLIPKSFMYPIFHSLYSLPYFFLALSPPSASLSKGQGCQYTSTLITASINLQQCLTGMCVCACMCLVAGVFCGFLEILFRNLLNFIQVRVDT